MSLDPQTAKHRLQQLTCLDPASPQSATYALLREALLLVASLSDYQILGICADTAAQGVRSLHAYAKALGYDAIPVMEAVPGAIYIKYNPARNLAYLNPYPGTHRGVLVSCQSAYADGVNDTFGHLPLDLFDADLAD
ncbi:DUF1824 family protein [Myxacorys almedinensis]|uniref:DUF1824 family protein n=1 Tax=Myxacorys almedinensis A TaxID=2690445 RepID=A0A8J7Z3U1_9CYAN|nr:DUF1824 family protein [Myxacorys almedinensis]NDJ19484.1 DUF1824 family protein [Myxacorys almedinensis A]